jgi:phosphatidate cytidylyltransferase
VNTPDQREPRARTNLSPGADGAKNLKRRIVSACVLAPAAIASAYIGGWPFAVVCAIAAGCILWEWTALVVRSADHRILVPGWAALAAALILAGLSQPGAAAGMIVIGAVLAGGAVAAWPRKYPAPNPPLWAAGGVIYAGVALISPVVLRDDARLGFWAVLFLLLTVWTTDIFAYFTGKALGGPLLWPQLSPNKTWSGAVGGLAGGVAAGTLVAYASGMGRPAVVWIIALMLSISAQGGDLLESAVKRRFGAKDAGTLIPGHGGVMDRLDGLLVAALIAALIGILHQGMAAAGLGLLVW